MTSFADLDLPYFKINKHQSTDHRNSLTVLLGEINQALVACGKYLTISIYKSNKCYESDRDGYVSIDLSKRAKSNASVTFSKSRAGDSKCNDRGYEYIILLRLARLEEDHRIAVGSYSYFSTTSIGAVNNDIGSSVSFSETSKLWQVYESCFNRLRNGISASIQGTGQHINLDEYSILKVFERHTEVGAPVAYQKAYQRMISQVFQQSVLPADFIPELKHSAYLSFLGFINAMRKKYSLEHFYQHIKMSGLVLEADSVISSQVHYQKLLEFKLGYRDLEEIIPLFDNIHSVVEKWMKKSAG